MLKRCGPVGETRHRLRWVALSDVQFMGKTGQRFRFTLAARPKEEPRFVG